MKNENQNLIKPDAHAQVDKDATKTKGNAVRCQSINNMSKKNFKKLNLLEPGRKNTLHFLIS